MSSKSVGDNGANALAAQRCVPLLRILHMGIGVEGTKGAGCSGCVPSLSVIHPRLLRRRGRITEVAHHGGVVQGATSAAQCR